MAESNSKNGHMIDVTPMLDIKLITEYFIGYANNTLKINDHIVGFTDRCGSHVIIIDKNNRDSIYILACYAKNAHSTKGGGQCMNVHKPYEKFDRIVTNEVVYTNEEVYTTEVVNKPTEKKKEQLLSLFNFLF